MKIGFKKLKYFITILIITFANLIVLIIILIGL